MTIQIILILFVAIVGISLTVIFASINDQQELSEINQDISAVMQKEMKEASSVTGKINSFGTASIVNSMNEDVVIQQIRVYDDQGNFVKSFPINSIIPGNSFLDLNDLPPELQVMLGGQN
ncbi:MAG: hypothetical protein HRU07_05855 [Nitrosopumilus sp.]|nr:hypothetical protein [Nitrosopumilus sp.]NRA05670.1 hypothetical protein [Nitrosopumilus sp.]